MTQGQRILVVRLGAMGDIIHTLPAVASLKHAYPDASITWLIESKWSALLDGNPHVNKVVALHRNTLGGAIATWRKLRRQRWDFVIDFQGLTKSAIAAWLAPGAHHYGFADSRETPASWFYSRRTLPRSVHMVDRNLELALCAGAAVPVYEFAIGAGNLQGELPKDEFVLANPLAGWGTKQWPLEYYSELALLLQRETGMRLVLNGPQALQVEGAGTHVSGLPGLIDATRRAVAVVGLDSGPLHLAAALGKPGVAIFGPTDPARNGPYRSAITVLRAEDAVTTYRRGNRPASSMRAITPQAVFEALRAALVSRSRTASR